MREIHSLWYYIIYLYIYELRTCVHIWVIFEKCAFLENPSFNLIYKYQKYAYSRKFPKIAKIGKLRYFDDLPYNISGIESKILSKVFGKSPVVITLERKSKNAKDYY